jgi:phosphatidylglycerol---prolipoprotein diacylglyceryl transferase
MLPVLQIGRVAMQLPGLLLLAGVWVGSWLAERQAKRLGLSSEAVSRLILVGLLAGLTGARLGFAARFPEVYGRDPLALLALSPATLSLDVGIGLGLIAALVYGQRARLPLWQTLDALAPGMAGLFVFLALAHLSRGDAFGSPADIPWAIELWGARRHPSQAYEFLGAVTILVIVLRVRPRTSFPGYTFGLSIALSAAARLVLEAFRGDSVLWFGSVRAAQVVSLVILMVALSVMRRLSQRPPDRPAG